MTAKIDFDCLIVGGGMVGASLALALQGRGYRVGLIEAHAYDDTVQPSYDARSTALSQGSRRILQSIGMWRSLSSLVMPIEKIEVSDQGHFGVTHITATEARVDALGYVIENRVLGATLLTELARTETQIYCPANIRRFHYQDDRLEVQVEDTQGLHYLRARLLLAADGVKSAVREWAGIGVRHKDYGQTAIVANITPQCDPCGRAFERFTAQGPLACLPMQAHHDQPRCALVWTLPHVEAEQLMRSSDEVCLQQLQNQFGHRLGRLLHIGQRTAYPLSLSVSRTSIAPRVALFGNAKQALHPVAGQGFNLALRDVAAMREILYAQTPGSDPGMASVLQCYEENRQHDSRRVIRFTDGLVSAFSNDFAPIICLRGMGLLVLDLLPCLRQRLTQVNMGLLA